VATWCAVWAQAGPRAAQVAHTPPADRCATANLSDACRHFSGLGARAAWSEWHTLIADCDCPTTLRSRAPTCLPTLSRLVPRPALTLPLALLSPCPSPCYPPCLAPSLLNIAQLWLSCRALLSHRALPVRPPSQAANRAQKRTTLPKVWPLILVNSINRTQSLQLTAQSPRSSEWTVQCQQVAPWLSPHRDQRWYPLR